MLLCHTIQHPNPWWEECETQAWWGLEPGQDVTSVVMGGIGKEDGVEKE